MQTPPRNGCAKSWIMIFSALEVKEDTFFYEFDALEAAMRQLDVMWDQGLFERLSLRLRPE